MGNRRQIHTFLGGRGHQHCIARCAAGHEIGMIAENGVVVGGNHSGGNVHDTGEKLPTHGEHGGNHQHQSLGRGKRGRQRARLQGAVASAGGACLRLHLNDIHGGVEQVFPALCGPFVHFFRHRGRRRDRENRRNLCKRIC
ncbi:hypothetical protein SDC9_212131 [bioreactor metagenome]|uniref:Uncharacterized protein n=1 Tax=bioreactor metagenome TaxID=1076179 RepID=A0A645JNM1_9ZZZZ